MAPHTVLKSSYQAWGNSASESPHRKGHPVEQGSPWSLLTGAHPTNRIEYVSLALYLKAGHRATSLGLQDTALHTGRLSFPGIHDRTIDSFGWQKLEHAHTLSVAQDSPTALNAPGFDFTSTA